MKYLIFKKYGVPASSARRAMVDDEDFDRVNALRWHETIDGYIARSEHSRTPEGKRKVKTILLHRFILDDFARWPIIDHIDGDRRNNTRANLRFCTQGENRRNVSKPRSKSRSGLKGVTPRPSTGMWSARISLPDSNGRSVSLGDFPTKEEAHAAYIEASKKYHGEFSPYATHR